MVGTGVRGVSSGEVFSDAVLCKGGFCPLFLRFSVIILVLNVSYIMSVIFCDFIGVVSVRFGFSGKLENL